MKSATRSAIIMVVALVLARITSGITEASATRRPSRPYTRQYWSTTARGSEADPILQVPEICCEVVTFCRNQASSASSEASACALGALHRHPHIGMIAQVLSHTRQDMHGWQAHLLQMLSRPHAREHQQLR